jgi:hypothetical protein
MTGEEFGETIVRGFVFFFFFSLSCSLLMEDGIHQMLQACLFILNFLCIF